MKKSCLFIINPISGGINKDLIPNTIKDTIDSSFLSYDIVFTKSSEDTQELARQALSNTTDVVVAVGGDGTINQVAQPLVGQKTLLGIIPLGSGNGLARHLGIPLNTAKAVRVINRLKRRTIDTVKLNDRYFFNVAGVGFDAHIAHKFDTAPQRGFLSYAKLTLDEFRSYRPYEYQLNIDGTPQTHNAFLICFANGSQYGNNAFIAPNAELDDGVLNISVMKSFKTYQMPKIAFEMFTKKFNRSPHIETSEAKEVTLKRAEGGVVNIDGEPFMMDKELNLKVQPASLQVIVP